MNGEIYVVKIFIMCGKTGRALMFCFRLIAVVFFWLLTIIFIRLSMMSIKRIKSFAFYFILQKNQESRIR